MREPTKRAAARVAMVGGDGWSADELTRHGFAVRGFGSTRFAGTGGTRRLLDAIAAGQVSTVVLLARWLGHSESAAVRSACRARGVAILVVREGASEAARQLRMLS